MRWAARGAALVWAAVAARAAAQAPAGVQPEVRTDAFLARRSAAMAAVGANVALDRYVRLDLVVGAGAAWGHGASGFDGRGDAVVRFLLDPDFVQRWAPYAGGGAGVRMSGDGNARGDLIAVIGVEGPRWGRLVPFVEAGFGGGTRLGVGVRRARRAGR